MISERTKAGMTAARRRGRHVGRPAKLAPEQLVYARRMIVEGEGRPQVARTLGVDPSTLRRLLMKVGQDMTDPRQGRGSPPLQS